MSPNPQSPDKPRDSQESKTSKIPTTEQLTELKNQIARNQVDRAVDTLIATAADNKGEIPRETVEAFVNILSPQERKRLADFLSNGESDPKKAALKKSLEDLQTEVSGQKPAEGGNQAVSKIVELIDKGIERLGVGEKLNEVAARFGLKVDAAKNIGMLRNMIIGAAAKLVENIAASFKKFSPDTAGGILATSLELRLINKAPALREAYKVAYTEWAKNPTGEPPGDEQAKKFYEIWKKAPAGNKPTYEQVAGAPAQPPAPAQPEAPKADAAKPAETKPAETAAEKVEGSKKIELEGGKWITFTKEKDKAIVETDKGKRQIKFNGQVPEVAVIKPSGAEKGKLEVKANGQTAKFDLLAMHKSLTDNPNVPEIAEGNIKINLEPV